MRRTDEDFKAEVLRRADAYRAKRKKQRRLVLTLCLPVLLCCGGLLAMMTGGLNNSGASKDASMEFAEAPAAAAPREDQLLSVESAADCAPEEGLGDDAVYPDYPASDEPEEEGMGDTVPEDFAIRFVWAIGAENIYDTYTGQLQKDLVLDGVATAEFRPEEEVLEEIYRKLLELDIASIRREMTSEVLTETGEALMCTPLEVYQIQFTLAGETYTITGDYTADFYPEDPQACNFMEFVRFMREIAWDTPEYRALPDSRGGYD